MKTDNAKTARTDPADFTDIDIADLDSKDEAEMTVVVNDKPTTWVWTFAGPGHARAIAQSNRVSRERLHEEREKEQARVNNRKWKAPQETPDEVRARNVEFVVERLIDWTPVRINGETLAFSHDTAKTLLLDPRKGALLIQALDFLGDDKSFTKRSASS